MPLTAYKSLYWQHYKEFFSDASPDVGYLHASAEDAAEKSELRVERHIDAPDHKKYKHNKERKGAAYVSLKEGPVVIGTYQPAKKKIGLWNAFVGDQKGEDATPIGQFKRKPPAWYSITGGYSCELIDNDENVRYKLSKVKGQGIILQSDNPTIDILDANDQVVGTYHCYPAEQQKGFLSIFIGELYRATYGITFPEGATEEDRILLLAPLLAPKMHLLFDV